jgi:hypothetical protein
MSVAFFLTVLQLIQASIFPQPTLTLELSRHTTRNAKSCERHCSMSRTASKWDPWRSSKARFVASFFQIPFQPQIFVVRSGLSSSFPLFGAARSMLNMISATHSASLRTPVDSMVSTWVSCANKISPFGGHV